MTDSSKMSKQMGISLEEFARLLRVISHPTRLHILYILEEHKCCVSKLVEATEGSQSNVSQHLAVMRNSGVINARREGNNVCYEIKNETVLQLLNFWENNNSPTYRHY